MRRSRREGQKNLDAQPAASPVAGLDAPAVGLHRPPRDGQPEPEAGHLPSLSVATPDPERQAERHERVALAELQGTVRTLGDEMQRNSTAKP